MDHKLKIEIGGALRETVARAVDRVLARLGDNVDGYKATISVTLPDDVPGGVDKLLDGIRLDLGKLRGAGVKITHTTTEERLTTGDAWVSSPMAKALEGMGTLGGGSVESVTISHGDKSVTLTPASGKALDLQ
jgi:hypothetical protein